MRSFVIWSVIIVSVVVLQVSVLPHYLEPSFKPDLLLVLMVYLTLRSTTGVSLPAAYGLGLLKDCLSGIYLGLNGFSFLVVYLVLKSVSERLYVQSNLLFVLTVMVATVGSMAINLLLLLIFSQSPGVFPSLLSALVPHMLTNAFVASLLVTLPTSSHQRTLP